VIKVLVKIINETMSIVESALKVFVIINLPARTKQGIQFAARRISQSLSARSKSQTLTDRTKDTEVGES